MIQRWSCILSLLVAFTLAAAWAPAAEVDLSLMPVQPARAFPNLKFNRPVMLTHAGDGSNRVFVPSQLGKIFVFPNDQEVEEPTVFLDLQSKVTYKDRENEEGFLGIAFHPRYKENGQFFVFYTTSDTPHTSVISRFRVSKDDPNKADPASEQELFRLEKKYWNHNGGTLVFGPDGYLYIALGDGGSGKDPDNNGQNLNTILGKMLRIDIDRQDPGLTYAIPKDNPFVGRPDARGEVWAYGLRNVWRMSFDRQTGTLWAADVGQDLWEEIDIIVKGGNYGWALREGKHPFKSKDTHPELIEPIWDYDHSVGKSITGGHVYRGKRLPELNGAYLYADYVTGKIWALWYDEKTKTVTANRPIMGNVMPIMSFGEDERGEVYYTLDTGSIYWFESGAAPVAKLVAPPLSGQLGTPIQLFNGKDLAGWSWTQRKPRADRGEKDVTMEEVWSVGGGVLRSKGKPTGYIRNQTDFTNFVLTVEQRHITKGNGGLLVGITGPDKVWPGIELQTQTDNAGDYWNHNLLKMTTDPALTNNNGRRIVKSGDDVAHPVGEWDTLEVTVDNGNLVFKVNGEVKNIATATESLAGKVGLQVEGAQMEFRKVQITPIEPAATSAK